MPHELVWLIIVISTSFRYVYQRNYPSLCPYLTIGSPVFCLIRDVRNSSYLTTSNATKSSIRFRRAVGVILHCFQMWAKAMRNPILYNPMKFAAVCQRHPILAIFRIFSNNQFFHISNISSTISCRKKMSLYLITNLLWQRVKRNISYVTQRPCFALATFLNNKWNFSSSLRTKNKTFYLWLLSYIRFVDVFMVLFILCTATYFLLVCTKLQ